ncbi:E3 ubiquitin-protein ligase AIRP2 [Senna tora]|uniref:E3 ubiquitin-protein ligase AIRP2 n=1 Tax=Senna tora TaxID=362788 RepID=A0A834SDT6_9FABA|nr:E3 ubiquitin-protein ligase AIRP2 [Senna tora]
MRSHCIGNPSGSNARMGLVIAWDDEENDTESTQGWKTNTLKDPLQGIGGPMTRARTKAMKEALNCFIRDLKELDPNYIKESTINMSSKSPRKVVTMLKAQQDDVQGLCADPFPIPLILSWELCQVKHILKRKW